MVQEIYSFPTYFEGDYGFYLQSVYQANLISSFGRASGSAGTIRFGVPLISTSSDPALGLIFSQKKIENRSSTTAWQSEK